MVKTQVESMIIILLSHHHHRPPPSSSSSSFPFLPIPHHRVTFEVEFEANNGIIRLASPDDGFLVEGEVASKKGRWDIEGDMCGSLSKPQFVLNVVSMSESVSMSE